MASSLSGQGYSGGIDVTLPIAMIMAGLFTLAIFNVIEINFWIFTTFRRRVGLYFWSLLIASWGIPFHATGFLLKFFQLCTNEYVNVGLIVVGWYAMVTGQSIVLYSRLHLIVQDGRKIRWVLGLIVVDFFLFHIPPTILLFGSNSSNPEPFLTPFAIYEKIQITAFSTQEFIISALYIWEARKMLRSLANVKREEARSVMIHLILVNILMIMMDITLLGTEYGNEYAIETTYKSALYSIKLKLEFSILNRLRALVKSRHQSTLSCETPNAPIPSFVTMSATSQPGERPGDDSRIFLTHTTDTSSDGRLQERSLMPTNNIDHLA
ncbi:hypothetical protein L207DRAFT_574555 [Hyaloscypha variabilis F]|jgi:hypothetical protein|uniref:DUF7703 domain-containing protein n=1 Tax=Hyaloscypha variabilis (strain UAMH 11265 / GT02V1 / F) TaxID=1149755 RepID=A0A2J6QRP8_HYAVF|nr:hypothetical protein L207DRAFT_574555 [Hyaloscypha variabilis F]